MHERNPKAPAELDRIISKALEKDRSLRYQPATDLRTDLKRVRRDTSSDKVAVASTTFRSRLRYVSAAAGAVVLIAAGVFWWRTSRTPPLTDKDVAVLADFANTHG